MGEFLWRIFRLCIGGGAGYAIGAGTGVVGGMIGAMAGGTLFMVAGAAMGFFFKLDCSPMPWTRRS